MKLIISLVLLCLLGIVSVEGQTGLDVPEMRDVDFKISKFLSDWNVPGASVAISKEGRLVYARGFGFADKDLREKVQPDHRFRIASVSKPVTAVAILHLLEQNKLSLDDNVFGYDGLLNDSIYSAFRDSLVEDITIRDLLQHTGGWNRYVSGDPMFQTLSIASKMNVSPPPEIFTIIEYKLKYKLDFQPGMQYSYSNFGYCLLGQIIERVSGMEYDDYVIENIFEPIGANSLKICKNLIEEAADREVYYHDYEGAPLSKSIYGTGDMLPTPYGGFDIEAMTANGGWISNASDLLKFVLAVDGFNSRPDILSPGIINIMRTPSLVNPNYAKGWAVNNGGNWWHNGSLPGTTALLVRTTSGQICWAVLINFRPPNSDEFNYQLDNMMWEAVGTVDKWPEHDLFDSGTGVNGDSDLIEDFKLYQNYPNPFNATTKIGYELNKPSHVKLSVYNALGQNVALLKNEYEPSGYKQIDWDSASLPSGIYYIELKTAKTKKIQKSLLIK